MMKIKLLIALFVISNFMHGQSSFTSEDILVMNDQIELPGTLTYNASLKKQPLLIYVPGSGNPDRNGNQPQFGVNSNYIKQFAKEITNKDIAVFRYDKRNVTPSNIKYIEKRYEFNNLVEDVNAIIKVFSNDDRFTSINLIGHSQGSLVAMIAAKQNDIDKYISLAGIGESVDKTIIRQYNAQNPELGKIVESHINELKSSGTIKEINPLLMGLFDKQNHIFLCSYFKIDPTNEIESLKIPILIINGNKDLQVDVGDAEKLHDANPTSQVVIIDKMNHVLKVIDKDEDNMASYMSPDFRISDELVKVVETFVKQ